jgi:hypothetical protein
MSRPTRQRNWVMIFILLSLLAHLLVVVAIVIINRFIPAPDLKSAPKELTTVSLSLEPPPPPKVPASPPPPPKHIFLPTEADAEAKHKETLVESDNDTRLKSESKEARNPDSILPDAAAKREHASSYRDAPNAPSKAQPNPATSASQNEQQKTAQQSPKTSPSKQQSTAQAQTTNPNKTDATKPEQNPLPTPAKQVAQEQLDANGLPVLPPINAPTMAPEQRQQQKATPASSVPQVAQDVHGAVGAHGEDSPEAMATELGRYKAKVYRAVGSRWYDSVDRQLSLLPVGLVHIQFTIYKDGSVETKVLEGDQGALQLLCTISLDAIRNSAPFDPFTDSMIKQVGDSYTDDFTFSIYGNGE